MAVREARGGDEGCLLHSLEIYLCVYMGRGKIVVENMRLLSFSFIIVVFYIASHQLSREAEETNKQTRTQRNM